jgi:simple sugar transport system permease protein
VRAAAGPLRALLLATLVGSLLLLLLGENPALAFGALLEGAFGSWRALGRTLQDATPLMITGLAVALAYRAGLFNIGVEGQMVLAALAAGAVGAALAETPGLAAAAALAAALVVGAAWAALAGLLRAAFRVHEVLATIMLNFVAFALASWLLQLPGIREPGPIPQTPALPPGGRLPGLGAGWSSGILLGPIAAALVSLLLVRTRPGFEIRAVGLREEAARAGGVRVGRTLVLAMALSGALAGLAGADQVLGVHGRYVEGFSPGYGFLGIAVAFLALQRPLAVIPAALLLGAFKSGSLAMDALTTAPREIVLILQALVLVFVAAEAWAARRRRLRRRVEGSA